MRRRTRMVGRRRRMRPGQVFCAILVSLAASGCGDKVDLGTQYVNPTRADKGLVVILPGIEGESAANRDIRKGLDKSGIPYALAIYRWGFPVPGIGLIVNQTNVGGNRNAGAELAKRIGEYQAKYPDRPIYLIGHSGGGGVAVFALEELGEITDAKSVEGAFLLSASISADYDLDRALRMTQRGLVNVYNPEDTGLLGTGTAVFGNVDGGRGDSAGRTGFSRQYPNVYERRITAAELGMHGDPHFIATNAGLIAQRAPAWIKSQSWPPAGLER